VRLARTGCSLDFEPILPFEKRGYHLDEGRVVIDVEQSSVVRWFLVVHQVSSIPVLRLGVKHSSLHLLLLT
jgi:hypothetical protein